MSAKYNVLPPVAKSFPTHCKKCDTERYHTVITHKSETTASVQCEVCKSKKTFKLTTQEKKGRRSTKPKMVEVGPSWDELNQKIGQDNIQSYSIRGSFGMDSAIDHKKFGLGFVIESFDHKIEVVFKDQVRQLIHNQT